MHADPGARTEPSTYTDPAVGYEELVHRWNELAEDPDSPDFHELSQFGEMIASPMPNPGHQRIASEVGFQLTSQLGRNAVAHVSVYTDRGIRVPDVVWMTAACWHEAKGQTPLSFVPDVCVEVLSPSNTREEIMMKVNAYLRGGARESIVVGLKGEVEFFGPKGKLESSALGITLALPPELF